MLLGLGPLQGTAARASQLARLFRASDNPRKSHHEGEANARQQRTLGLRGASCSSDGGGSKAASSKEDCMTRQELESQCMKLSHLIDTEVVERDPKKLESFDFKTLYVWMEHAHRDAAGDTYTDKSESPMLHGRLGPRDASGDSVSELATRLGLQLH